MGDSITIKYYDDVYNDDDNAFRAPYYDVIVNSINGSYKGILKPYHPKYSYTTYGEDSDFINKLSKILGVNVIRSSLKQIITPDKYNKIIENSGKFLRKSSGGSRRRRRPSRKYKKSAKRVFRKKSRSTRRR
jgi:hypothetical protein